MALSLYIAGFERDPSPGAGLRARYSTPARVYGGIRFSRALTLCMVRHTDAAYHTQLAGDLSADQDGMHLVTVTKDADLDQGAATIIPSLVPFVESQTGLPGDFLTANASFLSYRQVAWVLASMALLPQRLERLMGESVTMLLDRTGSGATKETRIASALDTLWEDLPQSVRLDVGGVWDDFKQFSREDPNAKFAGKTLRHFLFGSADRFTDIYIGGLNLGVPMAQSIGRMFAYGENRTSVASDTFDSEISSSWTNPLTNAQAWQWITGGYIDQASSLNPHNMEWNADAFADDQYGIGTCGNEDQASSSRQGVSLRTNGDNDDHYNCHSSAYGSEWVIQEWVAGSPSVLASTGTGWAALNTGDTISGEAEGTTLRQGHDSGGGDAEDQNTTDATLSGGRVGLFAFASGVTNPTSFTAWEGGDIGAGGGGAVNFYPTIYQYHRMMHG